MDIIVYSKSGCGQCVFTKKFLEKKQIPFIEKRVDQNELFLEEVKEMGYSSLPVVASDKMGSFTGYNVSKLQELVHTWRK